MSQKYPPGVTGLQVNQGYQTEMESTPGGTRNSQHPSMTDGFSGRQDQYPAGGRDQQYPAGGRDQQYRTGGRDQRLAGGRGQHSTGGRVRGSTGGREQFNREHSMVPNHYTPDIRSSFTPHPSIVDRGPGVYSTEEQVQYLANQMNEIIQKVYNALIKKK